jgi:hypothetical protein
MSRCVSSSLSGLRTRAAKCKHAVQSQSNQQPAQTPAGPSVRMYHHGYGICGICVTGACGVHPIARPCGALPRNMMPPLTSPHPPEWLSRAARGWFAASDGASAATRRKHTSFFFPVSCILAATSTEEPEPEEPKPEPEEPPDADAT